MNHFGDELIKSLLDPVNFGLFVLLCGGLFAWFQHPWFKMVGTRLMIVSLAFFLAIPTFALGELFIRPLENQVSFVASPPAVYGIILLTGDERPDVSASRGMPITASATQRHVHFARLAAKYPDAKLIVAGANDKTSLSPTFSMKELISNSLLGMGVDINRVVFETQSVNTYENAMFSRYKVEPDTKQPWLLVTSAYHMPRAILTFRKEGINVLPAPSDYFTTQNVARQTPFSFSYQARLLTIAVHEYLGLVFYRMTGWIDRLWL